MMKQDTLFLPPNTDSNQETMSFGEPDPISDWLQDTTISYMPSFLDGPTDIIDDCWWAPVQDLEQQLFTDIATSSSILTSNSTTTEETTFIPVDNLTVSNQFDLSKKRRKPEDLVKKPINKRSQGKLTKDGGSNINSKNGRWAEQLLNPCAAAISAGNTARVRHLIFVLRELASPTGDANYRLAFHGLQTLTDHSSSTSRHNVTNFLNVNPRFFQKSLINFNDINPWFTIPNNIANNSILQILSDHEHGSSRNLHILDIGVSHGIQWPTLLEALSRRPGGPPPSVRLTVVPPTLQDEHIPFANSPPGYMFISNIQRSANEYKINLNINKLDNCPLQNLNSEIIKTSLDETLIVCAQFRLHNLNHNNPDNRTELLKTIRNLEPKGVILSDNNTECSCKSCSNFETGFARKVDYLWSFLDSTSVAFKGRDMEERKMMEGEASKALMNTYEMNEKKDKWGERMESVGFIRDSFRENVMDGARGLLRKYDANWDLRFDEKDKGVGLWWKGQSVSFCSLWKLDTKNSNT